MNEPHETDRLTVNSHPGDDKQNNSQDKLTEVNSLKLEDNIVAHYTKNNDTPPVERVKFKGLDGGSICSDDSDDVPLPPIPDGGWGWVVVVSAFLVSACVNGLAFSFGLLHTEFTYYFETTKSKTSLIRSLFIATPLLAGPVMGALVNRYGCRVMTMIAGLISTIGFFLASLSNSVEMLWLTFVFLSGLAMGILYVTAVVSVVFWFDKRRNLAVSLASCGIGFRTLIYCPLTTYLIQECGWKGTIILLAGLLGVCGAVMRNPEWLDIKQKRERRSRRSSVGGESVFFSPKELKSLLKSGKSPDYILETLASTIAEAEQLEATTQMNAEPSAKRIHSVIHLPTFVQHNEKVPPEVIEKLMDNNRLYNIILQNYPDLITRRRSEANLSLEDSSVHATGKDPVKLPVQVKVKNLKEPKSDEKHKENDKAEAKDDKKDDNSNRNDTTEDKPKHKHIKPDEGGNSGLTRNKHSQKDLKLSPPVGWMRQISTDHHYFRDLPLYRNSVMHRGAIMNLPRYKLRASSLPDIYRNSDWSLASSIKEMMCYNRCFEVLKITFRMFTEFHFLMFNLASLILSISFIVPYFFLKLLMFTHMYGFERGVQMNNIIDVASSIGIVVLGWFGDQLWVNVCKAYAACLIICGASLALYPFFITNYWALAVISTVFGLFCASVYSYTPAILIELMPIDHFPVAYGLILLSQGIGHFAGPSIVVVLYDMTDNMDLTFYMGGFLLVIAGLCVGVVAYTKNARMCGSAPLLKEADGRNEEIYDV